MGYKVTTWTLDVTCWQQMGTTFRLLAKIAKVGMEIPASYLKKYISNSKFLFNGIGSIMILANHIWKTALLWFDVFILFLLTLNLF